MKKFLLNFISGRDGPGKSIETRQKGKRARRLPYIHVHVSTAYTADVG